MPFQFFQEEAKVVYRRRASRSPAKGRRPTYVVTREDIQPPALKIFGIFCGPFQEWMSYRPALTKRSEHPRTQSTLE